MEYQEGQRGTVLDIILLGGLNYLPMTGYELKQFIERSTAHFWHAQTSQIYRTLEKLEKEACVTSTIEEQTTRPDRRRYHITELGREKLRVWLEQPLTEIEPSKDTLLLKLFFAAQLDKTTILTQLRLQRALYQHLLTLHQTQTRQSIALSMEHNPALKRDGLMWDITRRLGELSAETYLRWLDESIQRIEDEF